MIYPFFVLLVTSVNGQSQLPQEYENLLNLHFRASSELATTYHEDIPDFNLYLQNLNEVTQLIFSENRNDFEELRKNEKVRLKALRSSELPSPYTDFIKAEIKIQWAFIKLKFGEQWNGVWALRSAYKIIQSNIEAYPDFALNYKTLGLLQVIFGAVPDRYHWVLSIFGLEGDTQAGLHKLHDLLDEETIFHKEIRLVCALIESYLMENHEGATELIDAGDQSITHMERYALALVLMKSHQSAKASELLKTSLENLGDSKAVPLFRYLLAETQFQEGLYNEAIQNYDYFLKNFEGINQLKDAAFKAGLCAFFIDDKRLSAAYFAEARKRSTTEAEVDKNAERMLESNALLNPELLQIRFSIDGGFYELAESMLNELRLEAFDPYQQFEIIYRRARLNHLRGNSEEAIAYYQQVIQKEEQIPENYFVPNSFLQMGYLQQSLGRTEMARMYFERVLTFRKHPYKNSLDSKAKIALKGLRTSGE